MNVSIKRNNVLVDKCVYPDLSIIQQTHISKHRMELGMMAHTAVPALRILKQEDL